MDHDERDVRTYAEVCSEVYTGGLSLWREKHGKRVRILDLLGNDLKQVTLSAVMKRGGVVQAYLTVEALHRLRNEVYFFRYQRVGADRYVLVGQSEA